ncbi:MAG: phosphoenolpyruvate synthase [Bacteroidales bacterium]|nr:phosphoenolpyruvate synthase [Bacteroidales bacterium]
MSIRKAFDLNTLPSGFFNVSFNLLMQKRIQKVMLICSNYDAFILEEDGRIDEQLYIEYFSQNLRNSPQLYKVNSAGEAFNLLKNEPIDLVIEMLNIAEIDTFKLANEIKKLYPQVPIVVLTHFSREVSLKLQYEDLSHVDHVFCWLGNADLLLAIIKLFEDRLNAPFDMEDVGVQAILLVEDSVRYLSSYLPILYKIVLNQAHEFMNEALNEHEKMLRMRGRPKILVAKNYDEAINLYNQYKDNLLGVITDISYKKSATRRDEQEKAGLKLARYIRQNDQFLPILIQSSDIGNEKYVQEIKAGFLYKYSDTVSTELQNFISKHFGFGDFIFRDPDTQQEIYRASDLTSLQKMIQCIPDPILEYHASRNEISKWLNSRALFPIAKLFKHLRINDFPDLNLVRSYIDHTISLYRSGKGRTIIAEFERSRYNKYMMFSKIGDGSVGGKARGLAFVNNLIEKYSLHDKYENTTISIPRTVVICTDIYDEFMRNNGLFDKVFLEIEDEEVLSYFISAQLPESLIKDLHAIVKQMKNPIAIRSSSKLEDSHYQPFAGIYNTYMVPNVASNLDKTVSMIATAIKCVYASVFFKESKNYLGATMNSIDEEKMGIVLQEVCGRQFENYFYPAISGITQSMNYYAIEPEKPEDGIVKMAVGLGKYVMGGGLSLRFCPKHQDKIIQLSSTEDIIKNTQKDFFALSLDPEAFVPSVNDEVNLCKMNIGEINDHVMLRYMASTYDMESDTIKDGLYREGRKIITFNPILCNDAIPIANIITDLLSIGYSEMNRPIEIEFAVDIDTSGTQNHTFSILQIRPIVENYKQLPIEISTFSQSDILLEASSALGSVYETDIKDFVFVDSLGFDAANNRTTAIEIGKLNEMLQKENRSYVLAGPGRWGSSDPWLGIPVKWAQISGAAAIIEYSIEGKVIEPSQGTHFFHNIIALGIGYISLDILAGKDYFDIEFLQKYVPIHTKGPVKYWHFEHPMAVLIDGKIQKGIVLKPGEISKFSKLSKI